MWFLDWLFGKRRRPDHSKAELHRKQGLAHLTNGDYAQAVSQLAAAVAYAPDDPDLHNGLAACYRALGDETAADRHKSQAQQFARQAAERREQSRRNQPMGAPKPKVLGGLDDGSPFVTVDNGNGVVMMMDRMAYDYMYGESKKPDPSQQALDGMLANVVRIKVWAGGMMRDNPTTQELLAEEADPQAVEAFRRAFRISEDPSTFNHCMCLGQPTIELLDASGDRVGTLGMQHGRAVRWDCWKHDALLLDGQLICGWLAGHGVPAECMR